MAKKVEIKAEKKWALYNPKSNYYYDTFKKTRQGLIEYYGKANIEYVADLDYDCIAVQVLVTPIVKKRKAKIDKKVSATFDKRVLAQGGETR